MKIAASSYNQSTSISYPSSNPAFKFTHSVLSKPPKEQEDDLLEMLDHPTMRSPKDPHNEVSPINSHIYPQEDPQKDPQDVPFGPCRRLSQSRQAEKPRLEYQQFNNLSKDDSGEGVISRKTIEQEEHKKAKLEEQNISRICTYHFNSDS
jgi:hypothetical protein